MRLQLRGEIAALHRRAGAKTIYVTHDQSEAMALADHLAVMKDGTIEQAGPPLDLYRRPATRFVAAFIGSPPMNFFDGTLARESGALLFGTGNGHKLAFPLSADWPRPCRNRSATRLLSACVPSISVRPGKGAASLSRPPSNEWSGPGRKVTSIAQPTAFRSCQGLRPTSQPRAAKPCG